MAGFEQGDVVRVPFPYTDRNARQRRPALIVSARPLGEAATLLWVVMITSADNRSWPGDMVINDLQGAGLPAPSVVRTTKIATIETNHAERIGTIEKDLLREVVSEITSILRSLSGER